MNTSEAVPICKSRYCHDHATWDLRITSGGEIDHRFTCDKHLADTLREWNWGHPMRDRDHSKKLWRINIYD